MLDLRCLQRLPYRHPTKVQHQELRTISGIPVLLGQGREGQLLLGVYS